MIWPYEATSNESQVYRPQQAPICSRDRDQPKIIEIGPASITQMVMNATEDVLYYIDRNNQLLKVNLALDGTDVESTRSEYVHSPFHHEEITGMDTCLRKQLIVTCSASYIMIWNYAERKFEVCFKCPPGEEATAVAMHPSGFHIVAAVGDKLLLMNVLSNSISEYHNISQKNCREIRFSNGGHMFAAGLGSYTFIYNFYTVDCPSNQQCKGHSGKIQSIDWFDDDSGFVDSCNQGLCSFYDLQLQREEQKRLQELDFKRRNVVISDVANVPGATNRAIVASAERRLWDTEDHHNGCETRYNISQIQILANGKAAFAGVGELGHPGAVQIWKFPLEMLAEVQAHGAPIERMRLTYNNDFLFTAGKDCCLIIHDVKDKDPRGGLVKRDRDAVQLPFSDEILTEKQEQEEIISKRDQKYNELAAVRDPSQAGVNDKNSANDQEEMIKRLHEVQG